MNKKKDLSRKRDPNKKIKRERNKTKESMLDNSKVVNKRYDTYVVETKKIFKASYGKEYKNT